ncbi:hypothetical protein, partial [Roseburia sp. OM04-10AA]|uniref:hypothetical protein n=1 Tax=Roseburia sp. OM04-10AA TaxID=2293141 RepID=UPI001A9B40CA
ACPDSFIRAFMVHQYSGHPLQELKLRVTTKKYAPDSFIRGFYGTPILRTSLARAKTQSNDQKIYEYIFSHVMRKILSPNRTIIKIFSINFPLFF